MTEIMARLVGARTLSTRICMSGERVHRCQRQKQEEEDYQGGRGGGILFVSALQKRKSLLETFEKVYPK